jgi:outer membrane protein
MKHQWLSLLGLTLALALIGAIADSAPHPQTAVVSGAGTFGGARIAFVDIQAISEKATFVQDLKKSIEGEFDVRLNQYQSRQAAYAKLLDEISRQGTVLSESAIDARYKQAFLLKAQLDEEKYVLDKFLKDSEEKKIPALGRILEVVQQVAEEEGYDVVLRRELLIYGHPSADLSAEVIARLNSAAEAAAPASSSVLGGEKPVIIQ